MYEYKILMMYFYLSGNPKNIDDKNNDGLWERQVFCSAKITFFC